MRISTFRGVWDFGRGVITNLTPNSRELKGRVHSQRGEGWGYGFKQIDGHRKTKTNKQT